MSQTELQVDPETLDAAIDPELRHPSAPGSVAADDNTQDASNPEADDSDPKGKGRKVKRARKPYPLGSEADFKRKEANRLAAERSRSRTAEKTKALNKAYALLSTEHDELMAAINQVEAVADETTAEGERKARRDRQERDREREQREVEAQVEAAIAVAQQEDEVTPGDRDRDERTLLAALMSGGMGMEGFENVGDDWVQGVENLMKEVETTGRLGELAAVAAVPAEPEGQASGSGTTQIVEEHQSPKPAEPEIEPSEEKPAEDLAETKPDDNSSSDLDSFAYNPVEAAAATTSAVAVVLNAEIDRVIRDEVALTRAATVRVEKEIIEANGGEAEVDAGPAMLESDTFSYDLSELSKSSAAVEETRVALEAEIEAMTTRVISSRVAKDAEEAKVAQGVEELYRIAMTVEKGEKDKIMDLLKSIRGYIGNLIWGLKDGANPTDSLLGTAFSTPAIARRRRGRPPKNSFPLRYNHASLIYPSLPLDSPISTASLSQITNPDEPPKKRRTRGPGKKTKLSKSITADQVTNSASAEEYILSHLQAANQNDGEGSGTGDGILGAEDTFQSEENMENVLAKLRQGGPGSCDICSRTETSVWRKLTLGGEDFRVCNACGLYHRKFGVVRPASLWGDPDDQSVKKRKNAKGPDDGRRNRKVKKMLENADQLQEDAAAAAAAAEAVISANTGVTEDIGLEEQDEDEELRLAAEVAIATAAAQDEDQEHEQAGVGGTMGQGMRLVQTGVGVGSGQVGSGQIGHHLDVDVTGFETIEEELRNIHGENMYSGMDVSD